LQLYQQLQSHIHHVVLNSYGQQAAPCLFLFNAASA
jgi:hypothetical protein